MTPKTKVAYIPLEEYSMSTFLDGVESYFGYETRLAISRDSMVHDGNLVLNELHLYGSSRLGMMQMQDTLFHYTAMRMYDLGNAHTPLYSTATITQPNLFDSVFVHQRGSKVYEGTNHLGNILVTYTDKRLTECQEDTIYRYVADVKSQTDYSAFHALLHDRQWYSGNDTSNYRFGGSNGQEKDDEIYGHGNSYTAEYWQNDPRLGRRWNVDPVVKPWESGYAVFANSPIWLMDPNGADTVRNPNGELWNVGDGYSAEQIGDKHFLVGENLKTKIWDPSANDGSGMYVNFINEVSSAENKLIKTNELFYWFNTVPGGVYSLVEYYKVNEFGWRGANGNWNSRSILEKGFDGKYVRGVQGYRNGLAQAKISVVNIKAIGSKIYVVGQLYNGVKLVYHVSEGDYEAVAKDGLDITMSYVMYAGEIPGLVIGGVYFTLDYVGMFTPINKESPTINRQFGEADATGISIPKY